MEQWQHRYTHIAAAGIRQDEDKPSFVRGTKWGRVLPYISKEKSPLR